MEVFTAFWDGVEEGFDTSKLDSNSDLVIYFGNRDILPDAHKMLRKTIPNATLLGCSTGGQIFNETTHDAVLVASSIKFSSTKIKSAKCTLSDTLDSHAAGIQIGKQLNDEDLAAVIVLSDGILTNGSELAQGISQIIGARIPVVGGLAGDGPDFGETLVGLNGDLAKFQAAAVGLYGKNLNFSHGSDGGWLPFGPRRVVTRSEGNILYELDGQPALDLYERYLGEDAKDLPSSALLFPLQISDPNIKDSEVVRTILNIDRENKSMIFAGNMPEGSNAQLMRGSVDGLTDGAANAAKEAKQDDSSDGFALLVSCIGRRLMMKQYSEDEVEAVDNELGKNIASIGFYSYGEICPKQTGAPPMLHNQTMTVSLITEREAVPDA